MSSDVVTGVDMFSGGPDVGGGWGQRGERAGRFGGPSAGKLFVSSVRSVLRRGGERRDRTSGLALPQPRGEHH